MKLTDLVTFSEAASLAGVSAPTLRKRMREKTAPRHHKVGREHVFVAEEVLAWKKKEYPDGKPRKGKRISREPATAPPCRAALGRDAPSEQVAPATPRALQRAPQGSASALPSDSEGDIKR